MAITVRRASALKALLQALRGSRRPGAPGMGARLAAFPRMLSQGFSGRYPELDKRRVAVFVIGLVYVISPVDIVPELFVPLLGLGDDAVVAAMLVGTFLSETDTFLEWEKRRGRTVPGETV
jgi:uncharacterized membrane protein YkvA (DUF1232 family)